MRQAFFIIQLQMLLGFTWLQSGHREKFFHPPFLTILKPLEKSEIMFTHPRSVKKAFFHTTSHQGPLLLFYLYMFSLTFYYIFKLADRL